mmetsp:Transcript_459/g.1149  ORF Transcript_459/g.1149 Transcript_459/m.1149 type:complete len:253 (+) Transcript_459:115-873(+)
MSEGRTSCLESERSSADNLGLDRVVRELHTLITGSRDRQRGKKRRGGVTDLFFYDELTKHVGQEASASWLANTEEVSRRHSPQLRSISRSLTASGSGSPHSKRGATPNLPVLWPSSPNRPKGNNSWPAVSREREREKAMARQLQSVPVPDRVEAFRTPDLVAKAEKGGTASNAHPAAAQRLHQQNEEGRLQEALGSAFLWQEEQRQQRSPSDSSSLDAGSIDEQRAKRGLLFTDAAHLISEVAEPEDIVSVH